MSVSLQAASILSEYSHLLNWPFHAVERVCVDSDSHTLHCLGAESFGPGGGTGGRMSWSAKPPPPSSARATRGPGAPSSSRDQPPERPPARGKFDAGAFCLNGNQIQTFNAVRSLLFQWCFSVFMMSSVQCSWSTKASRRREKRIYNMTAYGMDLEDRLPL